MYIWSLYFCHGYLKLCFGSLKVHNGTLRWFWWKFITRIFLGENGFYIIQTSYSYVGTEFFLFCNCVDHIKGVFYRQWPFLWNGVNCCEQALFKREFLNFEFCSMESQKWLFILLISIVSLLKAIIESLSLTVNTKMYK